MSSIFSINSTTVELRTAVTLINGKTFKGNSISISTDGNVVVDGETKDKIVGDLIVVVNADSVKELVVAAGDVTVNGFVGSLDVAAGDATVNGDVGGDVDVQSGDVKCGKVSGKISVQCGDVTIG